MINYKLLDDSVKFYEKQGFKRVESPWLVSEEVSNITKPLEAAQYVVTKKDKVKAFVASGEQSFLYMMSKGYLPNGRYQTITPCIRNDNFDETHTKYFMKNELIHINPVKSESSMHLVMDEAFDFFCKYDAEANFKIEQTSETSFDINYLGIEVGSYGYRECLLGSWIYGTGLAEPRFSRLLTNKGIVI